MYRLQGLVGVLVVMILATLTVYLWQRDGDDANSPNSGLEASGNPTPTAPSPTRTPTVGPTSTPEPLPTPDLTVAGQFAFDQTDRLVTSGLGLVFFGDTAEDAAEKAGTAWEGIPDGSKPTCYTVTPAGGPPGMVFTVVNGRIERVDVTTEIITTPSGAGVGMQQEDLLNLFGESLTVTDSGGGQRIEFVANDEADQQFRIVWQTNGSVVTSMRSGRLPHVEPATPCS